MTPDQRTALAYGLACHGLFALAVGAMAWSLYHGLTGALVHVGGGWAAALDAALLLQFPLGHSLLLTRRGGRLLGRLAPEPWRGALATTLFAAVASLQLGLTFFLWAPMGEVLWRAEGGALWISRLAFAGSWLLLGKAMWDAGLGVQTGALGWWAAFRGERPRYPDMPTEGTFKACRQPIYLAFALIMWTGPVMTTDKLLMALVWTAYCALGPLHKERRYAQRYGARFAAYQARVPYLVPGLRLTRDAQADGGMGLIPRPGA